MLTEKQIDRMLAKLKRFEDSLEPMIFKKVAEIGASAYETAERLNKIPDASLFSPVEKGFVWGGEDSYCWFSGGFAVPEELDGADIFIRPEIQGYEAALWVNGLPFGEFSNKTVYNGHGYHYCDLLKKNARAGERIDVAVEAYSGKLHKGCAPLENLPEPDYRYKYDGLNICVKDCEIQDFYFDLKVINELTQSLGARSFRRGELVNALYEVHKRVLYSYDDTSDGNFRDALRAARPFLKEVLAVKNGPEAPTAGLIGHSHIDTAWLWPVAETVEKCMRTFSNQLALMEQYPEYGFIQSSPCHSDMTRKYYPELFEKIKERVAQGRYEVNGGVWVECDCNLTSGESLIRQFLWGQRFTRKFFNRSSNCFWLPDAFGYCASIPQIMKGCGVDYFLTTKIDWNDSNVFPYDVFYWRGIDGTKAFAHFNRIHVWPSPRHLSEVVYGDGEKAVKERSVSSKRLVAYGYGDGGGGPQFEMIETARRVKDLNGCCKTENTTVGDFMKELEKSVRNPSVYSGELYLELHRGTLTNQHNIKRNNRKAELALRDLEYLTVSRAVEAGKTASDEKIRPLYEKLLINQFHDILPGTCVPAAHRQSLKETGEIIRTAGELIKEAACGRGGFITVTNTLSFDRSDPIFLECREGLAVKGGYRQQRYTDLDGKNVLIIGGVTIPAFSTVKLELVEGTPENESVFVLDSKKLSTPFAEIEFDEKGYFSSFVDKRAKRNIRGEGYPLNAFIIAEDLPLSWDNWDVDADIECKFADRSKLLSKKVVSDGPEALIIRSEYQISEKSSIVQDAIYFADSAEIRFDTVINWRDDHRFLKVAFDTSIQNDFARFEIQYGNVKRPTSRNDSLEKAKFEVANHKFTDLSETRFGVCVLNDCKYGISVESGKIRLSLHKGGLRPDFHGDRGTHRAVYSFLPHVGDFSAETVIKPAYELNVPVVAGKGDFNAVPLVVPKAENVIVEAIKPCEDNEKAFIARLYEAEGSHTVCPVEFFKGAKKIENANMLEEVQSKLEGGELVFHPFEIKTLKISY